MKKLITISLIFISGLSFGQNLWNPTSGSLTRNVKFSEGVQVEDTLLAKGLLYFPSGASLNYVMTSNANGVATWTNPASGLSPWTGNGTNVYLRDSTDNVGIGTSIPQSKLYVKGTANFFNSSNSAFSVLDSLGNSVIIAQWYGANRALLLGDAGDAFGGTKINIDDETETIAIISDSVFIQTTKFNLPFLPTDSTGLKSKDAWIDVNGFIRRKF